MASSPYGIADDAGHRIGKAVVSGDGSVKVNLQEDSPTGLAPGPYSYPDFAAAQAAVGGSWFLFGS